MQALVRGKVLQMPAGVQAWQQSRCETGTKETLLQLRWELLAHVWLLQAKLDRANAEIKRILKLVTEVEDSVVTAVKNEETLQAQLANESAEAARLRAELEASEVGHPFCNADYCLCVDYCSSSETEEEDGSKELIGSRVENMVARAACAWGFGWKLSDCAHHVLCFSMQREPC